MKAYSARLIGSDIADAIVASAPVHADQELLAALKALGIALVKAEGGSDENAATVGLELARSFSRRAQRLVEGLA